MDFQQPPQYSRPPPPQPPSMADPHYHQIPPPSHQRPPLPPPPNPNPSWYSPNQFQYQPPPAPQHSPSPPPPQNWGPPPPPYHAPPPHLHYPPPPPPPGHYPHPPPPPYPPQPHALPHPPQFGQSYPQVNQDWGHHQNWEYPAHNNEEDWAAKARAWAAAQAATDTQQAQSQFIPAGRHEEQNHFNDQYQQSVDQHFVDVLQQVNTSNFPPYSAAAPPLRLPVGHLQESASFSSGQPPYAPDGHLPYTTRNGSSARDSTAGFSLQDHSSTEASVRQQEVPSSYSSVPGKQEARFSNDSFYQSPPLPVGSDLQHHSQVHMSASGGSAIIDEPHYSFHRHLVNQSTDLQDKPLDFTPRFNTGQHMQINYEHSDPGGPIRAVDPVAAVSSNVTWVPPTAPGADSMLPMSSPVPGHSASIYGRMPLPGFQTTIPPGGASFGVGAGATLHSATFSDAYGDPILSDRPKKASVPNWLREEIIKKKAAISTSAPEVMEGSCSLEDEGIDKSYGKGDLADSRSIDSSKSTEEEDDEDEMEAASTATINQEIKRVLTEVLTKVTDELFDEIATKVLSEDDLALGVSQSAAASKQDVEAPIPSVPTPKASAKVLIPVKTKETESGDNTEKSVSSSPGDVLGLASYASDDDEENEIQSSANLESKENTGKHPGASKKSDDVDMIQNGGATKANTKPVNYPAHREADSGTRSPNKTDHISSRETRESVQVNTRHSSKADAGVEEDKVLDGSDVSKQYQILGEKASEKQSGQKRDMNSIHESRRISASKDRELHKGDDIHRRRDDGHARKGIVSEEDGSRDRATDRNVKTGERTKDSDSRKRSSSSDIKEDRKDREKDRRATLKEDNGEKRERKKDEKRESSRHKNASDSSRHKKQRSPSVGSRGRETKYDSVVSHGNYSSDEISDDSRRKTSKRHKSPSPVRSRKRQISRSPHSKHSHRRHSPYSSLESTRGRRSRSKSRSKSPVRRKR